MNVPVDNEGRCRSRHPRQRSHKRTRCDRAGGPKPGTGQWMSSETITPVYSDPRPPSAHKGSLTPPLNRRKGRGSAILTPHALVGRAARSGYALAAVALVIQLRASFGDDIDWVKAPQPNSRLLQYGASPAGGASHGASVPIPLGCRGSSRISHKLHARCVGNTGRVKVAPILPTRHFRNLEEPRCHSLWCAGAPL